MKTYTEQIIQKMIERKFKWKGHELFRVSSTECTKDEVNLHFYADGNGETVGKMTVAKGSIFLSTEAWRALGDSMGWSIENNIVPAYYAHELISHLFAGGDIESYCKLLING